MSDDENETDDEATEDEGPDWRTARDAVNLGVQMRALELGMSLDELAAALDELRATGRPMDDLLEYARQRRKER